MQDEHYDAVIVGSGAGGSTLARELSRKDKKVLILERGVSEETLGTFKDCLRYADCHKITKLPPRSREGVILWRTFMAGGSTMISAANGTPCLEEELKELGIDITEELSEVEGDLQIAPYHPRRVSPATREIRASAEALGFPMEPMPKFIDPKKCRRCGVCTLGCAYHAKWTAVDYLNEALEAGAEIRYGHRVTKVLHRSGKVTGMEAAVKREVKFIPADLIILSAGGMSTPLILRKSGIPDAGNQLFMDLFVNVYGVHPELDQTTEPQMTLVHHGSGDRAGFILSPYINQSRPLRFLELGMKGFLLPTHRLMGLMVKIKDDQTGRIINRRAFSKAATAADRQKLQKGIQAAQEILLKAGADSETFLVSNLQGAHPGGTAAIGKVVDQEFQTEIDHLYVCDASILPESPGKPPIMTILALAKRLAKSVR
jgi:choline dehydrogenase-like flavoprotein